MNAVSKSRPPQAIQVKRGNVIVKIYPVQNRVGDRTYTQYAVVYYEGAQRRAKRFADLQEAKREAEFVAIKLASGDHEVLRLTSMDRTVYLQSLVTLCPLNVPLNIAVTEYAAAVKSLPQGTTLKEACDFFRHRHPAAVQQRTVQQVVDEMLAAKRAANLSPVHVKDMESRLGRFARDFQMNISAVSTAMLQAWLDAMEARGRTKRNYLNAIGTMVRFAAARKYLPKEAIDEVRAVQRAKEANGEIEIFAPSELRLLLHVARPELIPWLTIAAFSGLRTAELQRLDWADVNLPERYIEIKASKAKTASRRLAPIPDNLAAWIAPFVQVSGRVTKFENMSKQIVWLVRDLNAALPKSAQHAGDVGTVTPFMWKHNGLRHSFISYRLAATKDMAQVALEAGNSPQMIFQHYRQLVTEAEAIKWFGIQPEASANVLPLVATGQSR
jgi:integrase